jgi:hypothetical protein
MQAFRYLYAAVAALFVVGVVYQVFLAGMAVFGGGVWGSHVDFGYLVASLPLLTVILAWPAKAGRRNLWLAGGLLVLAQVQTFLPSFRLDAPIVAALHPVNALALLYLGVVVAQRAWALARTSSPAAPSVQEA